MSVAVEQWLLHGDGTPGSRSLNEEQRRAVTNLGNTVTAAGAGSGKTFVLARRFAYLVCVRGYRVGEILTLTFTRKATGEMYERIYRTLEEVARRFGDPLALQAMDEFFSAKIQTLDSYCSYIVRMKAHYYGITPDFAIDNAAVEDMARREALPFLLAHRDNAAVQYLARTNSLETLADDLLVSTMLEHSAVCDPVPFREQLERQRGFASGTWEKLTLRALDAVRQLGSLFGDVPAVKRKTNFFTSLGNALALEPPERNDYTGFCRYARNFSAISLQRQRADSNPCVPVLKEFRKLAEEQLEPLAVFLDKYPLLLELLPLLEEFQRLLNAGKRSAGVLTFSDASRLALRILTECPDVRQAEKEAYRAVMIDEFQDDNALQKELLYCLAERPDRLEPGFVPASALAPDKLFFVGDEKQSIYRFRGADVSVFRGLSDELGRTADSSCGGALLQLSHNYRSQPDLIASFNAIFGGIASPGFGAGSSPGDVSAPAVFRAAESAGQKPLPPYEAEYAGILAGRAAAEGRSDGPHVHIRLFDKRQDKDDALRLDQHECEACFVAETIRKMLDGGRYRPDDIALLFKSKTHLNAYERQLRLHGIPYSSGSAESLFVDAPVNDMVDLLWLCSYPADSTAYASVLRSPFVSLSHPAVRSILCEGRAPFDATLSELLEGGEKSRYLHGCALFRELSAVSGRESICDTVSRLWYAWGYRYETLWNGSVRQYSELYDMVFELARRADTGGKGMPWFLESLRSVAAGKTRPDDSDIPLERGNAVTVMTIHASKGLEFPVVFLCGADGTGRSNRNDKAVYHSRDWGITVNLPSPFKKGRNFFYSLARDEEKCEAEAELRRLLYVGMTRAESELYVTGSFTELSVKKEDADGPERHALSFVDLLMPLLCHYVAADGDGYSARSGSPFTFALIPPRFRGNEGKSSGLDASAGHDGRPGFANNAEGKAAFASRFGAAYGGSAPMVSTPVLASPYRTPSSLEPETAPGKAAPASAPVPANDAVSSIVESTAKADGGYGFSYADFGTAAHLYLEAWLNSREPLFPARLVQNLGKKARQELESECARMAERFSLSEMGAAAKSAPWRRTEYAFKYKAGGCILNGTMDLIFRRADGGYCIVDYKTDSVEQPERYHVQQAAYRKAASAILGCPESLISCTLFYLRSGRAVDITAGCASVPLERIVAAGPP